MCGDGPACELFDDRLYYYRYEERVTWKSNTNFTAIKRKEICKV